MLDFAKIFLTVFILSITSGIAQASQTWQVDRQKSNISFIIHSTLHEVNGQEREISGGFVQEQNLIKGVVDVGVNGLSTNNNDRDRNMYKMFNASSFAQIHFAFDHTDILNILDHQDGLIAFLGVMTIHGISHPVTISSRGWMLDKSLVCEGNMRIHLKDYDLKPPSVLGLIRVKDEVFVQFRILFSKKGDLHAS